jgi:exoribonuclease-2
MLLAGEAAAMWARKRQLAFPYITQEVENLPNDPLPGLAGNYQKRRCMRPRQVSANPGPHSGLGLSAYTQVTSPLRRYTDLLAHQQIRASLHVGAYKDIEPLDADNLLIRFAASDLAYSASVQAERASNQHWKCVYLADKIGTEWEATVLELKGGDRRGPGRVAASKAHISIPSLAMELDVPLRHSAAPNDIIKVSLKAVRIPQNECVFEAE